MTHLSRQKQFCYHFGLLLKWSSNSLNSGFWVNLAKTVCRRNVRYEESYIRQRKWNIMSFSRHVGDYVFGTDGNVCRIANLFETKNGGKCHAHLQEFTPGKATILGETSDERELFELNSCYDSKVRVFMDIRD